MRLLHTKHDFPLKGKEPGAPEQGPKHRPHTLFLRSFAVIGRSSTTRLSRPARWTEQAGRQGIFTEENSESRVRTRGLEHAEPLTVTKRQLLTCTEGAITKRASSAARISRRRSIDSHKYWSSPSPMDAPVTMLWHIHASKERERKATKDTSVLLV